MYADVVEMFKSVPFQRLDVLGPYVYKVYQYDMIPRDNDLVLFGAVSRLLGVVETSFTETGLLLGAGPPVRPGSTLLCCVC